MSEHRTVPSQAGAAHVTRNGQAAHVEIRREGAVCPRCATVLTIWRTYGAESAAHTQTVCGVCGSVLYFDASLRLWPMTMRRWRTIDLHEREVLAEMQRSVRTKKDKPGGDSIVLHVD